MHEVTLHLADGKANKNIQVTAGPPGKGGAPTSYCTVLIGGQAPYPTSVISFTDGEHAGLTNEALLAIVLDRLEKFQEGPFACDENANALWHLKRALVHLHDRCRRVDDPALAPTP